MTFTEIKNKTFDFIKDKVYDTRNYQQSLKNYQKLINEPKMQKAAFIFFEKGDLKLNEHFFHTYNLISLMSWTQPINKEVAYQLMLIIGFFEIAINNQIDVLKYLPSLSANLTYFLAVLDKFIATLKTNDSKAQRQLTAMLKNWDKRVKE